MQCKTIFDEHYQSGFICDYIVENGISPIQCELESVSDLSPAIVSDGEVLARMIFSPHHVDEDGKIKSFAFKDVENKGMSVDRVFYARDPEIHSRGLAKRDKGNTDRKPGMDPLEYHGYITGPAGSCRAIHADNGQRVFYIFNTGLPNHDCHADVFLNHKHVVDKLSDSKLSKLRRQLMKEFTSGIQRPTSAA
jgi:hypothetical protein